jgi:hypothetical protein
MVTHCQHGGGKQAELCKALTGKTLFNALYGMYTVALQELKAVLKANTLSTLKSTATQKDGFKEIWRSKRHSTNKTTQTSRKAVPNVVSAAIDTPTPKKVTTRNFFTPLRACDIVMDSTNTEASPCEAKAPAKRGRPPPIVLTFAVNLIQLQKQLKGVVSENFEFRSTRNGTRVITRSMADCQSVNSHFDSQNLSLLLFFPKIRKAHKGGDTPPTAQHPCGRYFLWAGDP